MDVAAFAVVRATPLDVKAEADLHFLEGINQLIGHGWPYTAPGVEYPGWRFYAAAVFGEKNPWWIAMPDLSRYLQRISHLMRQGQPANDVALYLPTSDAWASFSAGRVHMIETLKEHIGSDVISRILRPGTTSTSSMTKRCAISGASKRMRWCWAQTSTKPSCCPTSNAFHWRRYGKLEEFARNGGRVDCDAPPAFYRAGIQSDRG